MPNLRTEQLGQGDDDGQWPDARAGFTPSEKGWWCDRCGALVERHRADLHDKFHAAVDR